MKGHTVFVPVGYSAVLTLEETPVALIRPSLLAFAAVLALASCSADATTAPAGVTAPSVSVEVAAPSVPSGPVAFDGSHVAADEWAEAAAQPDAVILDVRTPEEFEAGHIAGAVNIDVSSSDFPAMISSLDPNTSYAVYCLSGNRSRFAIEQMADLGYSHTLGLDGGIAAWVSEGYAITT